MKKHERIEDYNTIPLYRVDNAKKIGEPGVCVKVGSQDNRHLIPTIDPMAWEAGVDPSFVVQIEDAAYVVIGCSIDGTQLWGVNAGPYFGVPSYTGENEVMLYREDINRDDILQVEILESIN